MRKIGIILVTWLVYSLAVFAGTYIKHSYFFVLIILLLLLLLIRSTRFSIPSKDLLLAFTFILLLTLFNFIVDRPVIKDTLFVTYNNKIIEEDLKELSYLQADELGINSFANKHLADKIYNHQGFRSSFDYTKEEKSLACKNQKVLMFIGDSHTEGCCAQPVSKSFTDYFKEKFCVLNFGIGGMDPLQYELIAQKYIPELQPDLVIIPFCMQNDFVEPQRTPKAGRVLYYITNYGWLKATFPLSHPHYSPNSYFKDWEETKKFYLKSYSIAGLNTNILEQIIIKPVFINSFFYALPQTIINYYYTQNHSKIYSKKLKNKSAALKHLEVISSICQKDTIPLIFSAIPSIDEIGQEQQDLADSYQLLFDPLILYYPKIFTQNDFIDGRNSHFNNEGHAKYYSFLAPKIDSLLLHSSQ